jgi:protein-disulfide isomerase
MKRALPFVIIIGVLGCALLAAWYLKRSAAETPNVVPPGTYRPTSTAGSVKLGADPPHTLGTIDAPVMLEEFGDFECLPCGSAYPVLKNLKKEFGSDVVIVFRQFPLVAKHAHAMAAARAAEAAGLQGKFWAMHDLLYENQKTWRTAADPQSLFAEYAAQTGLEPDSFKRDAAGDRVNQRIGLDRERGYWIGVNSTPTVFLNGREVPPDSVTTEKLRDLIRSEIAANRRN